jgi:hypothetical protein
MMKAMLVLIPILPLTLWRFEHGVGRSWTKLVGTREQVCAAITGWAVQRLSCYCSRQFLTSISPIGVAARRAIRCRVDPSTVWPKRRIAARDE